jgi:hypothetical protein
MKKKSILFAHINIATAPQWRHVIIIFRTLIKYKDDLIPTQPYAKAKSFRRETPGITAYT